MKDTIDRFLWMESVDSNWRWNTGKKEWFYSSSSNSNSTVFLDCKTMKAFKRRLKKAPQGIQFRLVSRFIGFDILGVNK